MIDLTTTTYYENYRCDKLTKLAGGEPGQASWANKNPLAAIEDDEKDHIIKMKKMEEEMEEVFNKKVKEKNLNLDTLEKNEEDIIKKKRHLVDLEKAEMFSMRAQFEREKLDCETITRNQSSKSSESLGRKKHFRFSVGTLKFGKQ